VSRHPAYLATLLLSGALTFSGCATASESGSASALAQQDAQSAPTKGGTAGALIPIDSDNVAQAGYEATTRVMTVLFDSGGLYEYYDVPPALWEAFVAAQPDPWSLVGYPRLVQGGYAYQEIKQ
jgi:hypothetical protein